MFLFDCVGEVYDMKFYVRDISYKRLGRAVLLLRKMLKLHAIIYKVLRPEEQQPVAFRVDEKLLLRDTGAYGGVS
jgi:hypothetical protein